MLKSFQETSTTTSANQNEVEKEAANAVDETQASANNANDEVQVANDDGDVEMSAESSTDAAAMDVAEVVPDQEVVVQSA